MYIFLAVSCVDILSNVFWLFPKRELAIERELSNLLRSIVVYRKFF